MCSVKTVFALGLVGALMGPWMGLLTGVLANVIWTLLGNPVPIWFAYVAGVIGLLAGFAGRAGLFQRPSPRWQGLQTHRRFLKC